MGDPGTGRAGPPGPGPAAPGSDGGPQVLERTVTARGELVLRREGAEFEIISNGVFLMDTRDCRSERLMVTAALARCPAATPEILICGLGVGFSLIGDALADRFGGRLELPG